MLGLAWRKHEQFVFGASRALSEASPSLDRVHNYSL